MQACKKKTVSIGYDDDNDDDDDDDEINEQKSLKHYVFAAFSIAVSLELSYLLK